MTVADRAVHLWVIRLAASEPVLEKCRGSLARDERERAERFHFEEHRRSYVLGRGALRALLGAYSGTAPASVEFSYGPKGKPALRGDAALRFNVSNSGDLAAFAFTAGCELGVDLERIRSLRDLEAVARRFFAPDEIGELMALAEEDRPSGFFNCWTRKEAYIKAVGDGLYVPLDSFSVTLRPGEAARMIQLNGSRETARGWTLEAFDPAPGFAGALAYPEQRRTVAAQPLMNIDELLHALG